MKSSSFKEVIRLQFNALMMITIKGTLKRKRKLLARRFKQEVLFCEMGEAKLNEQGNVDKYSCDATTFPVLHFTVQISDEKISTALNKLSEKQRAFIRKRQILRSLPNYAPLFIGGAYCNIQLEVLSTMA